MFVFFISCDPESDIQLWLYHRVEERDYEARLNKSSKDVFLLGEENSLSQIYIGIYFEKCIGRYKRICTQKEDNILFFK